MLEEKGWRVVRILDDGFSLGQVEVRELVERLGLDAGGSVIPLPSGGIRL